MVRPAGGGGGVDVYVGEDVDVDVNMDRDMKDGGTDHLEPFSRGAYVRYNAIIECRVNRRLI